MDETTEVEAEKQALRNMLVDLEQTIKKQGDLLQYLSWYIIIATLITGIMAGYLLRRLDQLNAISVLIR